ncbi:ATPase [Erythrobacter sp. R86502]|uniref:ATPase n=1 Tax=Erythrobacter sp. R86502 TaxID=3093846 RepID=UPI0036D32773
MAERHQMRALGRKSGDNGASTSDVIEVEDLGSAEEALFLSETWEEDEAIDVPRPSRFGWIAPSLAILIIAGWTTFYVFAHFDAMRAGALPDQWANWIVQWAVPVGLVGIVWLLTMRTSRTEGRRFSSIAAHMNREGAALEDRLKVVNRELSLAREFLAAEARDLEALGRIAAERLSTHAGELQSLIASNGAQVEAIGSTSDTALNNMNRLRNDLPVIANAVRDVANQIGSAGRIAEDQLGNLSTGFERLAAASGDSETRVAALTARIDDVLGGYEQQLTRIETIVSDRFATLQHEVDTYRQTVAGIEQDALATYGQRAKSLAEESDALAERLRNAGDTARATFAAAISGLHETLLEKLRLIDQVDGDTGAAAEQRIAQLRAEVLRFDEQLSERSHRFNELIEQRQAAIETNEAQATEVLGQRLAALDDALAQRREVQVSDIEKLVVQGEIMTERVSQLGRVLASADQTAQSARETLDAGLDALANQIEEKRKVIAATEVELNQLTDGGIRLLEILQSGSRTCSDDLSVAIADAHTALEEVELRADKVGALMLRNTQAGSDLSGYLHDTRSEIDAAEIAIAGFKARLADDTEDALAKLQGLRGGFAKLRDESGSLAGETQEHLRTSLADLEDAINQAFATLDDGARDRMLALASGIGTEAVDVLERALRNEAASTLGKLEQSAAHASGVGREAAVQLRDQLVKVNELTGNLEQRVMRARDLAEEQVNNDFARRMALITDSLNSAAIDITGALSVEVADTAWEAYLKGDRGIFTRRAVRLIDNGTAKDIASLYANDDAFKVNVSRYIHDFEALLRQTLSTRDGHVLSVTMLGSDMGKLYVALAQAIQRFRA